jgi:hypothetical protein
MFERSSYPTACTPRQEILICQLHRGQWLPFGLVHIEGSRAQCRAPSLLSTIGLRLRVVPPTMGLSL